MKSGLGLLVALVLVGCESNQKKSAATPAPAAVTLDDHGAPVGLHQHRRWSEKIGQGAQPEGEEAFRNLQALGYVTVLSVDGSAPEVELAAKYGLAYVHVPIGYDGIAVEEQIEILKAVKESPGPVYFHCHHGKHRGPAAAMIAREGLEGLSCEDAVKALELSQTGKEYAGLYRDVREFKAPTDAQIAAAPKPQSRVRPAGVRAAMVGVDKRFDLLKASQAAGWKTPPAHPDVSPEHEAKMLWELYREMARLDEAKGKGEDFLKHAAEAEGLAGNLEEALRAGDNEAATAAFRKLKKSCDACHSVYRN
jgi:cytochrome c556